MGYWSVVSGEVGNLVFVARFDSFEAYGRTMAAIAADPISMEWQAKRLKAGQAEWGPRQYRVGNRDLIEAARLAFFVAAVR